MRYPPPSGGLCKVSYRTLFILYCLSALGTVPREGARDLFLRVKIVIYYLFRVSLTLIIILYCSYLLRCRTAFGRGPR